MDELIKTLFILWCDNCAWPSGMWLVFCITVATSETHHPLPHCAHIHCLVSINIQQASTKVNEFHFFPHGGIKVHTFALWGFPGQMPFHHTAPLLPSVTWQQNVTEYWWEGSTSTAIPPTSTSDTMGQHRRHYFWSSPCSLKRDKVQNEWTESTSSDKIWYILWAYS